MRRKLRNWCDLMAGKGLSLKIGDTVASRYVIKGEIGEGGMGRVYRAMPFHDPSQNVAIKIIQKQRALGPDDILRFQKEAALMSLLHHPNIICFHELGILKREDLEAHGLLSKNDDSDSGDSYYIVMEIADGKDLKSNLKADSRKDLPFFFQVGLQVSSALDYTHGKNIIHRDIKPQNIVVGKTWQEQKGILVKVLDFGVARLAEYTHSASPSEGKIPEIAGTPMYMAPEQTPLMQNAPVDHRVDLYSLGCVLYEILTGRPPFIENNREKLMARHVKAVPEPLQSVRPDVPDIIAAIVMKLLAKHPDDRYLTAFGLHADLQRAKMELRRYRRSQIKFPLGLKDGFKAVSAQLQLVGREAELQQLIEKYQSVHSARGRSHMVVIKGGAGMGKTRLLTAFRSYLGNGRIRFISTNFSRHETNLPYNALANGFNEYLMRLLKGQPHEAEELKRKIKSVMGKMAPIVAEKIPGLRPFIDTDISIDPELDNPEIDQQDLNKRRFQNFAAAFSDFTRCLALDNQPIVFILDDMHWADDNSLALVDQFFSHNNSQRFYLVISCRPSAIAMSQRLESFLNKFTSLRRRYAEINLLPLKKEQIAELSGYMLNSPESITNELVSYMENKTHGNPMYTVELLRSLVAQEKINYNNLTSKWDFDIANLTSERVKLDSVDLTVSRIQTYNERDRSILEIASIIGMTFQYELLLLGDTSQGPRARSALQKAIDEGLITRTTDDPDLRHLGKTYMFIHPRAREAILDTVPVKKRRHIHAQIALYLEKTTDSRQREGLLFSIVHHLNEAINDTEQEQNLITELGVRYNLHAGEQAMLKSSWAQSRRYFEKAESLIRLFDAENKSPVYIKIIERLADIESQLKNPIKSAFLYSSLLTKTLTKKKYAQIVAKLNALTIYGGKITHSLDRIAIALQNLKLPEPSFSKISILKSILRFVIDCLPKGIQHNRLYKLTQVAYLLGKSQANREKSQYLNFSLNLYRQAHIVLLKDHPLKAFMYHETLLGFCLRREATPATILKAVADHTFVMSHFGFTKASYSLIDITLDIAISLELRDTQGYIQLYKILTLDQYRGRFDDLDKKVRRSMDLLKSGLDNIHFLYGRTFLIFHDLFKARVRRLDRAIEFLSGPDLPLRNWLSPRGFSVYIFSLFLQAKRDQLVSESERYLVNLKSVNARTNDVFIGVIKTLLASSKGEHRRTQAYFRQLIAVYFRKHSLINIEQKRPFYFAHENDFICCFLSIFPEFHSRDQSSDLMNEVEARILYKHLGKQAKKSTMKKRSVAKLLLARSQEVLGGSEVELRYDYAIRSATATGDALLLLMSYYWLGRYLLILKGVREIDYITKVHADSHKLGFHAIKSLAEQTMVEFAIPFTGFDQKENQEKRSNHLKSTLPQLTKQSLDFIASYVIEQHNLPHLDDTISLLKQNYPNEATYILVGDDRENFEIIHQHSLDPQKVTMVKDYVSPYIHLRSTLFLPLTDSPWSKNQGDHLQQSNVADGISNDGTSQNVDSTEVLTQSSMVTTQINPPPSIFSNTEKSSLDALQSTAKDLSKMDKKRKSNRMNVIVPMPFLHHNVGVIFIEQQTLVDGPNPLLRQDLDYFGSQLGLIISSLKAHERRQEAQPIMGEFLLEKCSWLDIWSKGNLRRDRDSAWYLGVNLGMDDYLLVYLHLTGQKNIRTSLSTSFWYHLQIIRSLIMASERISISIIEIKEEITKVLASYDAFKDLENISLSFTVFNRGTAFAYSGHFGPSRPLVLGAENKVIPENRIVFNMKNGRSLRYWGITAELQVGKFYILPHDSSKLEGMGRPLLEVVPVQNEPNKVLQSMLEKQLLMDHIPRYYVAACFKSEEELEETVPEELNRVD